MKLLIISGMSGSGKTKAVNALEDIGYYCVDNIPPRMIPVIVDLYQRSGQREMQNVAMVVDARSKEMFAELEMVLQDMRQSGVPYQIVFLDASTDVLIHRYKETRRRHPLMNDAAHSLREVIETERSLLQQLREQANYVVDTSMLLAAQLRQQVIDIVSEQSRQTMSITILSFGFRNGLPPEADLVFDVRCLPNPHYIPQLRGHTGLEACVSDFVMQFPQTQGLMERLKDLLVFSIPLYVAEGKTRLVIAIGCTGGKHRSVAAAEWLSACLREQSYQINTVHRDKPSE